MDTRTANNISVESHSVAQTVRASSPLTSISSGETLKMKSSSQQKLGFDRDVISSTLMKSETVSKKAFALQDKVIFFLSSAFMGSSKLDIYQYSCCILFVFAA